MCEFMFTTENKWLANYEEHVSGTAAVSSVDLLSSQISVIWWELFKKIQVSGTCAKGM